MILSLEAAPLACAQYGTFSLLRNLSCSDYSVGMKFEDATIAEFISIYEEVHGEWLTDTEATAIFRKLVHLYRVLLRPLPPEEP